MSSFLIFLLMKNWFNVPLLVEKRLNFDLKFIEKKKKKLTINLFMPSLRPKLRVFFANLLTPCLCDNFMKLLRIWIGIFQALLSKIWMSKLNVLLPERVPILAIHAKDDNPAFEIEPSSTRIYLDSR